MNIINEDKLKLIEKHGLIYENGAWYSQKENAHKHLIFKEGFTKRNDLIGLLFRINKLCMAKVKYFRTNIDQFEPYKYHYLQGFIKTQLWDCDFFKHRASGFLIDLRFLQTITKYDDFVALCNELNSYEAQTEPLS